jgi:hypothetical protein
LKTYQDGTPVFPVSLKMGIDKPSTQLQEKLCIHAFFHICHFLSTANSQIKQHILVLNQDTTSSDMLQTYSKQGMTQQPLPCPYAAAAAAAAELRSHGQCLKTA